MCQLWVKVERFVDDEGGTMKKALMPFFSNSSFSAGEKVTLFLKLPFIRNF